MPLNPKHLLFPWVLNLNSPSLHNGGHNPQFDTIGVGHKNLCTKQGVTWLMPLQRRGFLTQLALMLLLLPLLHLLPVSVGECVFRRRQGARPEQLGPATGARSRFGGFGWVVRGGALGFSARGALLGRGNGIFDL